MMMMMMMIVIMRSFASKAISWSVRFVLDIFLMNLY